MQPFYQLTLWMILVVCCACAEEETCLDGKHLFSLGPEWSKIYRTRASGTRQSGWSCGARFNYQRLKRYHFYWGIEAFYGRGSLGGETQSEDKLKSDLIDGMVEAQFGYTFAQKFGCRASFTPFASAGYACEQHNYRKPSPIPVHFKIEYWYAGGGFLSSIALSNKVSIGLNGKIHWMLDATNKITHDPKYEKSKQLVKNEINYRIELPLQYRTTYCSNRLFFLVTPFYEFRHYGHQVNFPFDFLETKLWMKGITVQIQYLI